MDELVVFPKQVVFGSAHAEKWPALGRVTASGEQLAAAFEIVQTKIMPAFRQHSRLARIAEAHKNELVDLYNKVAADGRYLDELATHPAEVAKKLHIEVSDDAIYFFGALGTRLVEEFGAGRISKTAELSKEGLLEDTGHGVDAIAEPNVTMVEIGIGVVCVGIVVGVVAVGINIKAEIDKHSPPAPPHEQAIIMDESGLIKIS